MTHPWRQSGDGFDRKLNTVQVAEVKSRHKAGETVAALAREYGVSTYTIRNYLKGTIRY